jgi:hypothetical protein
LFVIKRNVKNQFRLEKVLFFHRISCRHKILFIGYLWLNKIPVSAAISISGHSSTTICEFYRHYRQLVSDAVDLEDAVIGGHGIIVEIDESKLGKRKYQRTSCRMSMDCWWCRKDEGKKSFCRCC